MNLVKWTDRCLTAHCLSLMVVLKYIWRVETPLISLLHHHVCMQNRLAHYKLTLNCSLPHCACYMLLLSLGQEGRNLKDYKTSQHLVVGSKLSMAILGGNFSEAWLLCSAARVFVTPLHVSWLQNARVFIRSVCYHHVWRHCTYHIQERAELAPRSGTCVWKCPDCARWQQVRRQRPQSQGQVNCVPPEEKLAGMTNA